MAVEASQGGCADCTPRWRLVRGIVRLLDSVSVAECPPQFVERVYDVVSALLRNKDPFADVKAQGNALALALKP